MVISTGGGIDDIMANKLRLKRKETVDLLRKNGGKTGAELKAEGKWKQVLLFQSYLTYWHYYYFTP